MPRSDKASYTTDVDIPTAIALTTAELRSDGVLDAITDGQMEKGRPLVLYIEPETFTEGLDLVAFMFRTKLPSTGRSYKAVFR